MKCHSHCHNGNPGCQIHMVAIFSKWPEGYSSLKDQEELRNRLAAMERLAQFLQPQLHGKWPGIRIVLCAMMFICSVPIVTPVIPPRNPKIITDSTMPENPGSPQGAFLSHSKVPFVKPRKRCPSLNSSWNGKSVNHAG